MSIVVGNLKENSSSFIALFQLKMTNFRFICLRMDYSRKKRRMCPKITTWLYIALYNYSTQSHTFLLRFLWCEIVKKYCATKGRVVKAYVMWKIRYLLSNEDTQALVKRPLKQQSYYLVVGNLCVNKRLLSYRFDKFKFLPLLNFLNEANIFQPGPNEVSVLHFQTGVGLKWVEGVVIRLSWYIL